MWSRIHFTQCEEISTVLVSDVKPPYQTMIAISTVLVKPPYQTMIAISTELVLLSGVQPSGVQPSGVQPPTTISLLWGRTAAKHWDRGAVMWLMISQELVVLLYMWIAVVSLPSESSPPAASSCPETHVDKVTGASASWCYTLGLLANNKVFSCVPGDCGWQDLRRAGSKQGKSNLDCFWFEPKPPSM